MPKPPPVSVDPSASAGGGLICRWVCLPGYFGGRTWYDQMDHRPGTLTFGTEKPADSWKGPLSRPGGFANLRLPGIDSTEVTVSTGRGPSVQITGDLTVSFWVKALTLPTSGNHHGVVTHGQPGAPAANNYNYWFGYTNNAGTYRWRSFHEYGTNSSNIFTSTSGYTLTNWHHVLFSRDTVNSKLLFVVDGVQDSNQTINNLPTGGESGILRIGSTGVDGQHPNCLIDDIRIYNRALSVDEAIAVYHKSRIPWVPRSAGYPPELPPAAVSGTVSPVSLSLTLPTVTATVSVVVTGSVTPVSADFVLPVVSGAVAVSAVVNPVPVDFIIPAVTAATSTVASGTVNPVIAEFVLPGVSPTVTVSGLPSPVLLTLALPSITAIPILIAPATVDPVILDLAIPSVSGQGVVTAAVNPVLLEFFQPLNKAEAFETAGVFPEIIQFTIPSVTGIVPVTGIADPVVVEFLVPGVAASYIGGLVLWDVNTLLN